MVHKIGSTAFSGTQNVFNGTLSAVVQSLLQSNARTILIAANVPSLTDSSTGVVGAVQPFSKLAPHVLVGSDSTPKAGLETALSGYIAAISELAAKADALGEKIGADSRVIQPTGTVNNGTIEALTKTVAGANAALAPAAGVNQKLGRIFGYLAVVIDQINATAHGVGVAPLTIIPGNRTNQSFADLTNGVGTAVAGSASAPGVLATAVNAELTKLANNIATAAAKLNEIARVTAMPPVALATA